MQLKTQNRITIDKILLLILCFVAVCANIGVLAGFIPQLDLIIHFQVQYLVTLAILAVIFICRRNWVMLVGTCICVIAPMMKVLPWYSGDAVDAVPQVRILSSNIKATNINTQAIQNLIEQESTDIVVLLEAMKLHQNSLVAIETRYPYRYSHSLDTGSGFLLYSLFPISNIEQYLNNQFGMACLAVTVESPEGEFDLIAVHPPRPGLRHGSTLRDFALSEITELLSQRSKNAVVIGDLNTTMWSRGYELFVEKNRLHNLRQGRGVMPSWHLKMFGPLLAIPIDHCFVRGDVHGSSFELIPLDGSDHDAIVVGITEQ
ncbi:MAG: hypothetical protein HOC27_00905 [Phycisphaerae bacterium]|nr:hypothetical protein [Phycisphaerae bacterium]